ncbi:MAG: glycosyltransferase [Chloroflexota bacterium]
MYSLVIPVFKDRASLALLLRCLEAQTFAHERFECLVVDDGSKDGTPAFLQRHPASFALRPLAHAANQGRSAARNTGWRQAQGEWVIFLDADMLPAPDWLAHYDEAIRQGRFDVVSGGRYHLNLGAKSSDPLQALAAKAATTPQDFLGEGIAVQFERLHAQARLSMYPSFAMEKFETQLRDVCRQYPNSLLCAYAFITSNVAVRRSLLERTNGFDPGMRRGEDTELGVRLWELGARFGFAGQARAYHLFHTGQGDRGNTINERLAFFYRHPYLLAVFVYVWFVYHDQAEPQLPDPIFESLLSLLAAQPTLADMDLGAAFEAVYHQPLPADCACSRDLMLDHYGELSGIDRAQMAAYLDHAVERGLVVQRRNGELYFDFNHTTNWLRKCTPYQQHELRHTRYHWLRASLPGLAAGGPSEDESRPPLKLQISGRYEIELPAGEYRQALESGSINIPLPVEHACQTGVHIMQCSPADLLQYADRQRSMVFQYPLKQALNAAGACRIGYDFTCRLQEHLPSGAGSPAVPPANLAAYLRPTYPPAQLAKAGEILKKIFSAPVDDAHAMARRIYQWVLDNTLYLQSYLADTAIIETRFGPCMHLARLFVNLCRLMRIPAREQCGAMLSRAVDPTIPHRLSIAGRGYSALNHTWAEFYTPRHGWLPVDFSVADFGRRTLTAVNVTDELLRARLVQETALFDGYYFGRLDPFRIYANAQANKLPTCPVVPRLPAETLRRLILQTRHSLECDYQAEN